MLEKQGMNQDNQQFWRLLVPDEHCVQGLEIGIYATAKGLMIGGAVISWSDLSVAKNAALSNKI